MQGALDSRRRSRCRAKPAPAHQPGALHHVTSAAVYGTLPAQLEEAARRITALASSRPSVPCRPAPPEGKPALRVAQRPASAPATRPRRPRHRQPSPGQSTTQTFITPARLQVAWGATAPWPRTQQHSRPVQGAQRDPPTSPRPVPLPQRSAPGQSKHAHDSQQTSPLHKARLNRRSAVGVTGLNAAGSRGMGRSSGPDSSAQPGRGSGSSRTPGDAKHGTKPSPRPHKPLPAPDSNGGVLAFASDAEALSTAKLVDLLAASLAHHAEPGSAVVMPGTAALTQAGGSGGGEGVPALSSVPDLDAAPPPTALGHSGSVPAASDSPTAESESQWVSACSQ